MGNMRGMRLKQEPAKSRKELETERSKEREWTSELVAEASKEELNRALAPRLGWQWCEECRHWASPDCEIERRHLHVSHRWGTPTLTDDKGWTLRLLDELRRVGLVIMDDKGYWLETVAEPHQVIHGVNVGVGPGERMVEMGRFVVEAMLMVPAGE